jgi:putative addiction module component (TIGR02574 family)
MAGYLLTIIGQWPDESQRRLRADKYRRIRGTLRAILRQNPMASRVSNPPAGFDDLTVDEKLDYVESLWDRIAAKPDAVPVPDWHLEVIEQRMNGSQAGSRDGRSWDEFREELRTKLRQHNATP